MATGSLVCLDDFEKYAFGKLDRNALDYYRSGANDEQSLRDNRAAFGRYRFRPRFLQKDVSKRDLSTRIQGQPVDFPVGIAPTALQRMAHPDGEVATGRAAAAMKTCMVLSTMATSSIEEVAQASPEGLRWFQICIYRDREVTKELVRRAERSGYKALVLTVDTPMFGRRLADTRNKFTLPPHLRMANFKQADYKSDGVKGRKGSGQSKFAASLLNPSLKWTDVRWLKQFTKLPIIVKGILTGEDAVEAVRTGVDGIVVSNHGARQLDGVPATIDVLPEVVRAVNGQCEVYLDGGVRTGTDVLKALALGAKAVFIGRPALYGLAYDGEAGVKTILQILRDELSLAMALAGCASLSDINSSLVVHQSYYLHPKL
ncbi:hydroxyacid oxidase 1 [Lingula anatina]|uniref:(S)-2-hydroxy-acid oxidase n=1 Tax=Lingula anatina TaxID=7574 RepID=A0A1S3JVI7_LINAN|nr:hydroxyacid oxidase 1 [Lingula anatina]|eukprot:XP_013414099.1 hydroxyacid oxidase 1 [Lingula anatina]